MMYKFTWYLYSYSYNWLSKCHKFRYANESMHYVVLDAAT